MTLTPWHGAVLTAAALVSAPATWSALVQGGLPVSDAITRFLLCVALCWVALNVAMPLLTPGPTAAPALIPPSSPEFGSAPAAADEV